MLDIKNLKEDIEKLTKVDFSQPQFENLINCLLKPYNLTIQCSIGAPEEYDGERWTCVIVEYPHIDKFCQFHHILSEGKDQAFASRKEAFDIGIKYALEMLERNNYLSSKIYGIKGQ